MSDLKAVGAAIAQAALEQVPAIVADETIPSVRTANQAIAAIKQVVTQDRPAVSFRVWAFLGSMASVGLALANAVATDAHVQASLAMEFGVWAPVITSGVSAVLAMISKIKDPRPIR